MTATLYYEFYTEIVTDLNTVLNIDIFIFIHHKGSEKHSKV